MKIDHLTPLGRDVASEDKESKDEVLFVQKDESFQIESNKDFNKNSDAQASNKNDTNQHYQNCEGLNIEKANDHKHTKNLDLQHSLNDIESELENIAINLGRKREDFSDGSTKIMARPDKKLDFEISGDQKVKNFDIRLVSIHPKIKSQIITIVSIIRSETETLKKMLKKL